MKATKELTIKTPEEYTALQHRRRSATPASSQLNQLQVTSLPNFSQKSEHTFVEDPGLKKERY
jgi:hypothetical protein